MPVRDKSHLVRLYRKNQIDKTISRVAFNIEFSLDYRPDIQNITVPDMSFIRAWMYRYTISAKELAVYSGIKDIWNIASPCIPQCCNLIDVHTQFCHILNMLILRNDIR